MLKEEVFEGQILSNGIGFGKPIFLDANNLFEKNYIFEPDLDEEIFKFKKALKQSKNQILEFKKTLSKDKLKITFDILNTHLEILNDPHIIDEVISRVSKHKKCIEAVFHDIIIDYKNKIKDPFFKEKVLDITDVFKRISTNLRAIKVDTLKKINSKSIIFSNEIIPSDVFEIDSKNISAFISQSGCYESHAAIIARSKNIPFLTNVDIEKLKKLNLKKVIVDANLGKVITNPSLKTYHYYKNYNVQIPKGLTKIKLKKEVNLYASISQMSDIKNLSDSNIKGIGLLRSEILFLESPNIPSESIQLEAYQKFAAKMQNRLCVIRLFDLGADKSFYNFSKDLYNFFGLRGVGVLLENKMILEEQLKAILKINTNKNIGILIPFVKDIDEIKAVKHHILKLQKQLQISENKIQIGSMIETPAAVLMLDEIINEIDFLAIGCNDLIRYTFAAQDLSMISQRSFLKIIKMILQKSNKEKKVAMLCLEKIDDINLLNNLIDLGVHNISISIRHFELFKKS